MTAMNHKAPIFSVDHTELLRTFTEAAVGQNTFTHLYWHAVASSLLMANMNSLPLDWTARQSVGGANVGFYIVKQLPVLPPSAYLQKITPTSIPYIELIMPRVLQLVYTAHDMVSYAEDLGYNGPPFEWDDDRRLVLKCELDAIYAHIYDLERIELEWILDAQHPGVSFPTLKRHEMDKYGEYRTKRLVLEAYDRLATGNLSTPVEGAVRF